MDTNNYHQALIVTRQIVTAHEFILLSDFRTLRLGSKTNKEGVKRHGVLSVHMYRITYIAAVFLTSKQQVPNTSATRVLQCILMNLHDSKLSEVYMPVPIPKNP